jgi:hypothetical protein
MMRTVKNNHLIKLMRWIVQLRLIMDLLTRNTNLSPQRPKQDMMKSITMMNIMMMKTGMRNII